MSKCKGCGITLQNTHDNEPGYTKNLDNEYCQSCFRLRHYRDFRRVKQAVNDGETLSFIESFDGTILWIVDVTKLNQSMHSGLLRAMIGKRVLMVVNKRDVLPRSINEHSIKRSIMSMLKGIPLSLMDIVFVSAMQRRTLDTLLPYLEDDRCAFVGNVNAGKSSLLNALMKRDQLSVSPVASTTADVIHIEHEVYDIYDTPGLNAESNLLSKFSDEGLVLLSPKKTIKPHVFQIYEKQALVFGNLGAFIIEPKTSVSVISYLPIKLKRVKQERIDVNLGLEHELMIENPKYRKHNWPVKDKQIDLEIFDIGFVSFHGELKSLETYFDEDAEIVYRKALF
ncbi:GTP-binding protein [Erysipelothrix larvae]|uniref:GTP-binding protein n=1 Tax=Erysipelothrix larvae TaxID=1514105 RepID=A0A0X8GZM2_9FIRM|nr:GTPase [Erysipelothrix larvae]AMC93289.1 GTP-binding protein [Erysipelothrix larvae]